MDRTKYYSLVDTEIARLAEETWEEFHKYISTYQWAFDDPSHSPRAADIAYAIKNRGKKGACTFEHDDGSKYILPILRPWCFKKAIADERKVYYVSYGRFALLMLDTDLHHAWQSKAEGKKARDLLNDLCTPFFGQPVLFRCDSERGGNDYLKVDLQGTDFKEANAIFDRLEKALRRFLASYGNLADFEVKGRCSFLRDDAYTWKQYGKLPIHRDWSDARLQEFKDLPNVPLRRLVVLCDAIEKQIPAEVLEKHNAHKKSLGDQPIIKNKKFLVTPSIEKALFQKHGECWSSLFNNCGVDHDGNVWLGLQYYQADGTVLIEPELRELRKREEAAAIAEGSISDSTKEGKEEPAQVPRQGLASSTLLELSPSPSSELLSGASSELASGASLDKSIKSPLKINLNLGDLTTEPDSFERQREALLRLSRYLKRVPTTEEALQFLRDQRAYTGSWEDNLTRRRTRIESILKFISRTFNPGKCANGSVNVGKYDAWALNMFPNGIVGKRRRLTEEGEVIEFKAKHVSPEFIGTFMAVCEYALLINKNQDNTLPHNRARDIWTALYEKGLVSESFCARSWAVCREEMVNYEIIQITNRDYYSGKAMEWDIGPYFPFLGLWKKREKSGSFKGIDFRTCLQKRTTREHRHNTLLRQQLLRNGFRNAFQRPRPPPVFSYAAP